MPLMKVNSHTMLAAADTLAAESTRLTALGQGLIGLNAQAETFIATWLTAAGQTACAKIFQSRLGSESLVDDLAETFGSVVQVVTQYTEAEEQANQLIARYEQGLPSGWNYQGAPTPSRLIYESLENLRQEKISHLLGGVGVEQSQPKNLLSYIGLVALAGSGRYLDIRASRGNLIAEAKQKEISRFLLGKLVVGVSAFDRKVTDISRWLGEDAGKVAKRSGLIRPLEHSEVLTDPVFEEEKLQMVIPRTAADFAYNYELVSKLGDKVDGYMTEHGRVEEYQGVVVQRIINPDGTETAIVYVTGTDFESKLHGGDPAAAQENTAEFLADPDAPLAQSHASMQLVEQALIKAGVPAGAGLVMAGFSKGASTAYNFAHNKEMQRKYDMQMIYDQGGPTAGLKSSGKDIKHIKVSHAGDPVPVIQGRYGGKEKIHNIRVESEPEGGLLNAHSAEAYKQATAESIEANLPIMEIDHLTAGAKPVGEPQLVAGTTQPLGVSERELDAYGFVAYSSLAYEGVNRVEEFLPQRIDIAGVEIPVPSPVPGKPMPNIPDLPTVFTPENNAGDFYESVYETVHGQPWDSSPAEFDFSPDKVVQAEEAYTFTLGSEEGLHLAMEIDSGVYSFDVKLGEGVFGNDTQWSNWQVDAEMGSGSNF